MYIASVEAAEVRVYTDGADLTCIRVCVPNISAAFYGLFMYKLHVLREDIGEMNLIKEFRVIVLKVKDTIHASGLRIAEIKDVSVIALATTICIISCAINKCIITFVAMILIISGRVYHCIISGISMY